MATRRMFSKEITNTSDFLMMSQSAQNLYFHFGMNADDDGFCEVFTVMRMTDSKPDDLRALHERGFLYIVDNKVCIIKDWHENNQLRVDRYKQSKYFEDPKYKDIYLAIMSEKIKEISLYTQLLSSGIPVVAKLAPQVRLGKDRIEKVRVEEKPLSAKADVSSKEENGFSLFWENYPKKELKKKTKEIWDRKKLDSHLQEILTFIASAKNTDRWKKGYVKQPPVFLNGECWNDDLAGYNDKTGNKKPDNVLQAKQGKYDNFG